MCCLISIKITTAFKDSLLAKYSSRRGAQSFLLYELDLANPYPGKSTNLSESFTSKKLISVVLPGVLLILANFGLPVNALRALDFPALDLPAKRISSPTSSGRFLYLVTPSMNFVSLKRFFI